MGMSFSGEYSDVNNDGYSSGSVSVITTQTEAKVGATKLKGRENITMTNKGTKTVYYGPNGVTSSSGDSLLPGQFVSLNIGDATAVYVICATGDTSTVIVQESS